MSGKELERKYSQEEGDLLIKMARSAIQMTFSKVVSFASLQSFVSKTFPEKRGVFVGLWQDEELRGCRGVPCPSKSLEETLREVAIESALKDERYAPLCAEELSQIKVEVSVLTTPKPIEPDQIQLGVHGLLIHQEEGSGLLLPSVPLEYGWNVEMFLVGTCLKGNLPVNAWKRKGSVYAFEVQVFKE